MGGAGTSPGERREPGGRLDGAAAWIALAATFAAAVARGGNIPVAWLALAVVVFALFAALVASDLARGAAPRQPALTAPKLLAVAALGWGMLQTTTLLPDLAARVGLSIAHPAWSAVDVPGTVSADPVEGRQAAVRLAVSLVLFAIAVRAGRDGPRAERMLRAVALSVAALSATSLVPAVRAGVEAGTLTAGFVNPNSLATFAAFGLIVALARLTARASGGFRGRLERFFGGAFLDLLALLFSTTALVASGSRGGLLAGGIGVAVVLAARRRAFFAGAIVAAPVVAAGLVAAGLVALDLVGAGVVGAEGDAAALVDGIGGLRLPVYRAIVGAILDRPLLGHGLGAFQDAFRAEVPRVAGVVGEWDFAHDSYLELCFELGLPAAGAFLVALALVTMRVLRAAFSRGAPTATVAGAGCAAAAAAHAGVDFSLQIPAVGAVFALVLGLAVARAR